MWTYLVFVTCYSFPASIQIVVQKIKPISSKTDTPENDSQHWQSSLKNFPVHAEPAVYGGCSKETEVSALCDVDRESIIPQYQTGFDCSGYVEIRWELK